MFTSCSQISEMHCLLEAMRYQAGKSEMAALLEIALGNAEKARLALEAFERDNPPQVFRKKPIGWAAFEQSCGARAEMRGRQAEELMDVSDYIAHRRKKNIEAEVAEAEWAAMLKRGHDGEGEMGPHRMLWIPLNRKRMRDTVSYVDQGIREGSRQVRNTTDDDRRRGRIAEHNNLINMVFELLFL